jgi:hypothetical protein
MTAEQSVADDAAEASETATVVELLPDDAAEASETATVVEQAEAETARAIELSPDCIRHVLDQLKLVDLMRVRGIDKCWHEQVQVMLSERRQLDLYEYRDCVDDNGLSAIVRLTPELEVVSCCGCALLTNAALDALANSCTHLRDVNLSCVRAFTFEGVRAFCERLLGLRDLQLSGCAIDAGLMRKHFGHLLELEDEDDNMGSTD